MLQERDIRKKRVSKVILLFPVLESRACTALDGAGAVATMPATLIV